MPRTLRMPHAPLGEFANPDKPGMGDEFWERRKRLAETRMLPHDDVLHRQFATETPPPEQRLSRPRAAHRPAMTFGLDAN